MGCVGPNTVYSTRTENWQPTRGGPLVVLLTRYEHHHVRWFSSFFLSHHQDSLFLFIFVREIVCCGERQRNQVSTHFLNQRKGKTFFFSNKQTTKQKNELGLYRFKKIGGQKAISGSY